jgi:hypothetical protein
MNILPSRNESKNVPAEKCTSFDNVANMTANATASAVTKPNTKPNPAHAMIAGYLAGFSGTIVGYPLDSLKVWVQTNTLGKNRHLEGSNSNSNSNSTSRKKQKGIGNNNSESVTLNRGSCGKSRSSTTSTKNNNNANLSGARRSNSTKTKAKASLKIPSTSMTTSTMTMPQKATDALGRMRLLLANPVSKVVRTARALYSGVTGPLFTVGMVQSVNFATYDATRRFLYDKDNNNNNNRHLSDPGEYLTHDSLQNVALSGSVGGMATAVLTAPLLMIKINQQITGNSFRRAVREIFVVVTESSKSTATSWRFRPFRPYGSAFVPHALSESIGRAIYVTTYEGLKRSLANSNSNNSSSSNSSTSSLSLRERMACAAASGIVCWATFFPLDALRNRMYHAAAAKQGGAATATATNAIVDTIRTMRNERAFYRGFSISILRAGPVAASVLPVYDLTLEWLSSLK